MDTLHYHLDAKKVKASGGAELVALVPRAVPASSGSRGEVLDFARCRQKLETKNAWEALNRAAGDVADGEEEPEPAFSPTPKARSSHGLDWLEVCASVAVIWVSLCAGWAFLRLL